MQFFLSKKMRTVLIWPDALGLQCAVSKQDQRARIPTLRWSYRLDCCRCHRRRRSLDRGLAIAGNSSMAASWSRWERVRSRHAALFTNVSCSHYTSGLQYPGFLIEWIFCWIESSKIQIFELNFLGKKLIDHFFELNIPEGESQGGGHAALFTNVRCSHYPQTILSLTLAPISFCLSLSHLF